MNAESSGTHLSFVRDEIIEVEERPPSASPRCRSATRQFRVVIPDDQGNSKMYEGDEAQEKVDLFVPCGMREFFFFDGERLDRYFKEATGQRIRNAIHQISQVGLLDRTKDHLEKVVADLQKDAGKLSPDIERIRRQHEEARGEVHKHTEAIEGCKAEIVSAKERIHELELNLKDVPATEELEGRRQGLKTTMSGLEDVLRKKRAAKDDFLLSRGMKILLKPAIAYTISVIDGMYRRRELPPTFDKRLLEKLMADGRCICGRPLTGGSSEESAVKNVIDTIRLSPEASQRLMTLEASLHAITADIASYAGQNSTLTEEIATLEREMQRVCGEIAEIDSALAGFNLERIKEWTAERNKLEEAMGTCQQRLGVLKELKASAERRERELAEELKTELKKESRVAELKNDIAFAESAIHVLATANKGILDKIRCDIEKRTDQNFKELHWKKETYEKIVIDHDYTISPVHVLGLDSLGTMSGGEREVLALSFSIALHEISGFSSAMVIDRPLAMVSGETRSHIAKIFSKIGSDRQIILLLTPEDYASDVCEVLKPVASTTAHLRLLPNENELTVEDN
jgi:DNA sulfur modification protein DndD